MVYIAEWNIRHNGKRIAIGEQLPKEMKKEEIERLLSMKAIKDPDVEAKAIKEAAAKKAEATGE
ncbi:hypothetical protein [Paenibacillus pseudetheri]|uniref:Uncharacterized protein n=1 Tax=Paenibacillus pseudetheri TaxID=2897682 RepID=A0ABM9BIS6_9BACL|nr:hypothetical protein [Paenibacillus pseudetheri]CAH1058857.1 hypothetical protein PAECIP111894_05043 [Paenibacillus pseudetheri]